MKSLLINVCSLKLYALYYDLINCSVNILSSSTFKNSHCFIKFGALGAKFAVVPSLSQFPNSMETSLPL